MVLRRCRRMLGDEDSAWDALQDVFAKLQQSGLGLAKYPSSLLYTAATRICLDRIRSAPARNAG